MAMAACVHCAGTHAQAGRRAEAEAALARVGDWPHVGWRRWYLEAVPALVASLRGDAAATSTAAERALATVRAAPVLDHWWAAGMLVPALARVGQRAQAHALLARTLAHCDERLPGDRGRYLRARLLTLRAWLSHLEGDPDAADADLRAAVDAAGDALAHLLRREWPRIQALVWDGLARGVLAPELVVRTLESALPGGIALLAFLDHPSPDVRRAALAPAVASGHPRAATRLRELAADGDPATLALARGTSRRLDDIGLPLVISVLGGFSVRRAAWIADDATWERPTAARLVRFLLVHRPTPVPEDVLFAAFWADKSVASARRALQVAVSRARAVLDPPGARLTVLESTERTYALRLSDRDVVDVDEFERAADQALAESGPERARLLDRAERLWTGEPLPEDRYADWAQPWRERLSDRYRDVLAELGQAERDRGDLPAALRAARRLVELDPLDEAAHRDLMLVLARSGRTARALRQFLACRRALVEQLGVEPSALTADLQARILAGDPV